MVGYQISAPTLRIHEAGRAQVDLMSVLIRNHIPHTRLNDPVSSSLSFQSICS
jgi:hypothetical protein